MNKIISVTKLFPYVSDLDFNQSTWGIIIKLLQNKHRMFYRHQAQLHFNDDITSNGQKNIYIRQRYGFTLDVSHFQLRINRSYRTN